MVSHVHVTYVYTCTYMYTYVRTWNDVFIARNERKNEGKEETVHKYISITSWASLYVHSSVHVHVCHKICCVSYDGKLRRYLILLSGPCG